MATDTNAPITDAATASNEEEQFKGNETILATSDDVPSNGQEVEELPNGADNVNVNGNGNEVEHTNGGSNGLDEEQKQQQVEAEQRQQQEQKEADDLKAKEETERLEKIKVFVESQSDLYKKVFSETKELVNVNVCQKLEECINSSKWPNQ